MRLIEVLNISSAHEFKIKDPHTNRILWKGAKSDEGYQRMLEDYQDVTVIEIKARSEGWGRSKIKSILVIEIQSSAIL